ncbi:unnamed protein product [marine sediment metagenome]|uniref:Uncharacterized protein n=1 Tax=marine sediment metagenome TaxID=412755 RepID=X1C793_9ZZZZ
MKLKTLKDLIDDIAFPPLKPRTEEMLHDAAKEWIKLLSNEYHNEIDGLWYLSDDVPDIIKEANEHYAKRDWNEFDFLREWIRYFFNLEEK